MIIAPVLIHTNRHATADDRRQAGNSVAARAAEPAVSRTMSCRFRGSVPLGPGVLEEGRPEGAFAGLPEIARLAAYARQHAVGRGVVIHRAETVQF